MKATTCTWWTWAMPTPWTWAPRPAQELLQYAGAEPVSLEDMQRLNEVFSEKWPRFPYRLDFDVSELPSLLNMSMKSPLWEELGERCLACAACTNVCPTCFCFNVKDEIELNLTSGRTGAHLGLVPAGRVSPRWPDGHNFRQSRALRQRHRFMRKGQYILRRTITWAAWAADAAPGPAWWISPRLGVFNELYRQKEAGGQS